MGDALLSELFLSILWGSLSSEQVGQNGSSHGQKQVLCRACGQSVAVRYARAYWDLNARAVIFERAIRAWAEGNSLRSTAPIVQVDKDTTCDWLDRAAQPCRQVLLYLWRDLAVAECQRDELWSFVLTSEAPLVMAQAGVRILWRCMDLDGLCARLADGTGLWGRQAHPGEC